MTPRISVIKNLSCSIDRNFKLQHFNCSCRRLVSYPTRWYAPASRSGDRARMSPSSSSAASDDATSIDDLVRRRRASRELAPHLVVLRKKIASAKENQSQSIKGQSIYARKRRKEGKEEKSAGKKDTEGTEGTEGYH